MGALDGDPGLPLALLLSTPKAVPRSDGGAVSATIALSVITSYSIHYTKLYECAGSCPIETDGNQALRSGCKSSFGEPGFQ